MSVLNTGAASDWAKIVLLPLWLIVSLKAAPYNPTWLVAIKVALVTLLVVWSVQRRWTARVATQAQSLVTWPDGEPKRYSASGDACDMWTGPCSCGATHKDGH